MRFFWNTIRKIHNFPQNLALFFAPLSTHRPSGSPTDANLLLYSLSPFDDLRSLFFRIKNSRVSEVRGKTFSSDRRSFS